MMNGTKIEVSYAEGCGWVVSLVSWLNSIAVDTFPTREQATEAARDLAARNRRYKFAETT